MSAEIRPNYGPIIQLQRQRNAQGACASGDIFDAIRSGQHLAIHLRNGIQVELAQFDPRVRTLAEQAFPHFQPYDSLTPLGTLHNRLNGDPLPPEAARALVQNVDRELPGFLERVAHHYGGGNFDNLPRLRVAIEKTLLSSYEQLTHEEKNEFAGTVWENYPDRYEEENFGENHMLDNWQVFGLAGAGLLHFPQPAERIVLHGQDNEPHAQWDAIFKRHGLNERVTHAGVANLQIAPYAPHISAGPLSALQQALQISGDANAALDATNTFIAGFADAVRRQYGHEGHFGDNRQLSRAAVEHTLMRHLRALPHELINLNDPSIFNDWGAIAALWHERPPIGLDQVSLIQHGNVLHVDYTGEVPRNQPARSALSTGPQMRTYYYPSGQDQRISADQEPSVVLRLPPTLLCRLPLSVQEEIAAVRNRLHDRVKREIADEEILLDLRIFTNPNIQAGPGNPKPWRQFTLHSLVHGDHNTGTRFRARADHELNTDTLNPLYVGLFEPSFIHSPGDAGFGKEMPVGTLQQRAQIYHDAEGGIVRSPDNMQCIIEPHIQEARAYFVGVQRDRIAREPLQVPQRQTRPPFAHNHNKTVIVSLTYFVQQEQIGAHLGGTVGELLAHLPPHSPVHQILGIQ